MPMTGHEPKRFSIKSPPCWCDSCVQVSKCSWFVVFVLFAAAVIGYTGTNNLLDNLKAGPHANTFAAALYIRVFL